jgi:Protein of unknown function (DUF4197)
MLIVESWLCHLDAEGEIVFFANINTINNSQDAGGGRPGGRDLGPRRSTAVDFTGKTLDGLFLKLAQEEKLIRQDPVARSTGLLKETLISP